MTKYCRRAVGLLYADSSASPPLFARGIQFLHTLESGNPEATHVRLSDVFPAETTDWIPAFEGVKKSTRPTNSSSFPRKRESRGGAHKTLRCFSCGNERLDSRFRGNDEVLSVDYCLSLRRIFGGPAVICERRPISSHALSWERWRDREFSQFHRASLCSDGGFGSVVKCGNAILPQAKPVMQRSHFGDGHAFLGAPGERRRLEDGAGAALR